MSTLSKFLKRFSPEYLRLGQALLTVAGGIALQPRERDEVVGAANEIITAARNIQEGLKTLKDNAPSTAQVKAAVTAELPKLLPDLIGGLVEVEVRKRLEELSKTNT